MNRNPEAEKLDQEMDAYRAEANKANPAEFNALAGQPVQSEDPK